ncbi:NAD-dependent epimerase/dehydratase family protein [Paraburkholderia phosphatilytica]|uniref:NAD-dependent epimerase/dehydratase family protein n=1 Tax=Paraburkholderia phosphatilytica TaxID=2282883 RepID=UPI000E46D15D|nr:NAD-dependent epimerase/dehydratase family protein [Paraburkholderia phosphatilytica]
MIATRLLRRPRVLIIGCGDVGLRCVPLLQPRARIFALTTQPERRDLLRAAGVTPILGDLDVRASLARLSGLAPTALHLAPPQKTGDHDERTRALLAALAAPRRRVARANAAPVALARRLRIPARHARCVPAPRIGVAREAHAATAWAGRKPSVIVPEPILRAPELPTPVRLIYASTTGVYGDCGGAKIDETRTVKPANDRAKRRVSAERQLRRAAARGVIMASIARIPGIYAANRLPLARLHKGTPALVDADDVYTSHIHADDLAAILVRMTTHGRPSRVIHASDGSELKMGAYFDRVADAYGVSRAPRVTREAAEQVLEPMLLSFMRESRRLSNARMTKELRVRLRYPSVDDFLREAQASDEGAA